MIELGPAAQIFAFVILSAIALGGALGMATTMSMFRSGVFLVASFIGVAGLFILLSADLLALLQIMMYVGGMLVMILFMVLFSHDPGGAMMAGMEMTPIEKFFSRGLAPSSQGDGNGQAESSETGGPKRHEEMDHEEMDMSMTTPVKRLAGLVGIALGVVWCALLVVRPAWPVVNEPADPRSAERIGHLLMSKYMMAFEGAGILILIGIFGAVLLARPGEHPSPKGRGDPVATEGEPAPSGGDPVEPLRP